MVWFRFLGFWLTFFFPLNLNQSLSRMLYVNRDKSIDRGVQLCPIVLMLNAQVLKRL